MTAVTNASPVAVETLAEACARYRALSWAERYEAAMEAKAAERAVTHPTLVLIRRLGNGMQVARLGAGPGSPTAWLPSSSVTLLDEKPLAELRLDCPDGSKRIRYSHVRLAMPPFCRAKLQRAGILD